MSKKTKILFPVLIVVLVSIFLFSIYSNRSELNKQVGPMSTEQQPDEEVDKRSYALNELVTGSDYEEREDSWGDYTPISQGEFYKMLEEHKQSKKEIDFKGLSIFNSSYKITFNPEEDARIVNPDERDFLIDTVGDKSISDAFSHVYVKKIGDLSLYFFFQSAYINNLMDDWNKENSLVLYVFMPHVNHFSDQVPLLVNRYDVN